MPQYRRAHIPGGCFFITMVTDHRRPLFAYAGNVTRLRRALRQVMHNRPLQVQAVVVMPDHMH